MMIKSPSRPISKTNRTETECHFLVYNAANYIFETNFTALVALFVLLKKKTKSPHKLFRTKSGKDLHLIYDHTKFKEYFRLSPFLFSKLLDVLKEDMECVPTSWVSKPLTAHQKLCIILCYLATGETFQSLAFQFRAHQQSAESSKN